jgi:hypothetical protein
MNLPDGTEVAVIVDGPWHSTLCKALVLFETTDEPFHLMFGRISSWAGNVGLWLIPENRYTNVGLVNLFVPWRAIISVAMIEEGKKKEHGYSAAGQLALP